jgi:hypothetical protein
MIEKKIKTKKKREKEIAMIGKTEIAIKTVIEIIVIKKMIVVEIVIIKIVIVTETVKEEQIKDMKDVQGVEIIKIIEENIDDTY